MLSRYGPAVPLLVAAALLVFVVARAIPTYPATADSMCKNLAKQRTNSNFSKSQVEQSCLNQVAANPIVVAEYGKNNSGSEKAKKGLRVVLYAAGVGMLAAAFLLYWRRRERA